jgi:hypothetical protein
MRISEAVSRELKLVRGVRTEFGEGLKTGKAALGGCFAPHNGRLEKQPA